MLSWFLLMVDNAESWLIVNTSQRLIIVMNNE